MRDEPIYPKVCQVESRGVPRPFARAAGEIFPQQCIKDRNSPPPDVRLYPNKFWCTWLGQGGALKVVSEGFGGAMMLVEFFSDLIFQIFS